jgi:ABC-2 type transport system permease protein
MKTYEWLVRRELWENRAIWIVPSAIAVALILATLFGHVNANGADTPVMVRAFGGVLLFGFGAIFFVVMSIYAYWYLLDCLYADRKDRSVLFWKSLPVSDTATVLAKLFTGLIAIPLVYFAVADVATLLMAFIVSIRGGSAISGLLWQPGQWVQLQALWLYLIVTTGIWYLPFSGWLLLVSAWAKRAVMLWSILPLLGAYLLERWFFGTHWLGTVLFDRSVDYLPYAFHDRSYRAAWQTTIVENDSIVTPTSIFNVIDPVGFFSSPATWVGIAVGSAFIVGAIQLRLRRTES